MKRKTQKSYLLLFGAIFLLMSFPKSSTEHLRGFTVAALAPTWIYLADLKLYFLASVSGKGPVKKNGLDLQEELQRLQVENLLLANQVNQLQELLQQELNLDTQWNEVQDLSKESVQHTENLCKLFVAHLKAIPARVIHRSPSSWASSLWLNVGESNNPPNKKVIAKNSPVVVGKSVVGVIDYVGSRQSRVRLITDSGLTPSVRAIRGQPQNVLLADHIHAAAEILLRRTDLFSSLEEKTAFIEKLDSLRKKLMQGGSSTWYLAKGELQGSQQPLWRAYGQLLHGVGFNQDFIDEDSPARDLRTGKVMPANNKWPTMPILKVHDILITTGMDGVFPPGLRVAEVTKIPLLKEGDYYYEIEAKPSAGNLDELSLVFVLPPIGYDDSEKPPILGL